MMDYSELIERCEDILKSFDPVTSTLDSHAYNVLGAAEGSDCDQDKVFIKQVLYGCVRRKAILKVTISAFYHENSSKTSRADYTNYMILAYLSLFRLKELGIEEYCKIIHSQAPEKMHVFLDFMFNEDKLEHCLKDEWIKIYDLDYVEEDIIKTLLKVQPEINAVMDELSVKAFGMAQMRQMLAEKAGVPTVDKKPPTIVQPFNLTRPKPRTIPQPMKITQNIVANEVPRNLNNRTLASIEQERKAARQKTIEETQRKYEEIQCEFKLHKGHNKIAKQRAAKEKELQKMQNKQFRANPIPDFSKNNSAVKLNTSAILREDALYKKKQEQEARLLQAYEEELRDSTDFYKWQSTMKERDERQRLEQVEQRRNESIQSALEAKEASQQQLRENRMTALEMKKIKVEIKKEYLRQQQESVAENQVKAKKQIERRGRPSEEQDKIYKRNQKLREECRKESADREARKEREDKLEQARRNDLIRQIRALERVPKKRVKVFDPSETGNHNLLDEMSLTELRERLAINEIRVQKEKEELKQKIVKERQAKEAKLTSRLEVIRKSRSAKAAASRAQREAKKKAKAEQVLRDTQIREEKSIQLADKLLQIRASREQELIELREEEAKVQKKRLFLGAAKEMVEEKVHQEFFHGLEREARTRQDKTQQEVQSELRIHQRMDAIRRANAAKAAQKSSNVEAMKEMRRVSKQKQFAETQRKKQLVRTERQRYEESRHKLAAHNTYANTYNIDIAL